MPFKIKGREKMPIPEASRFDKMSAEDLFLMLESSLGTATHRVDTYRIAVGDEKEPVLVTLQVEVENALAAVKALRRKLVVTVPKDW
jgi:hypothetical protein